MAIIMIIMPGGQMSYPALNYNNMRETVGICVLGVKV